MILTLMLIILTATLVIVIIGFVMDRIAIQTIKSGMRTINKRIKRLERVKFTVEGCYVDMDTQIDTETETADGGDISAQTDEPIQDAGD